MKEITLSVKFQIDPDTLQQSDDIVEDIKGYLEGEFPEFESLEVEKTNEIDVPTAD